MIKVIDQRSLPGCLPFSYVIGKRTNPAVLGQIGGERSEGGEGRREGEKERGGRKKEGKGERRGREKIKQEGRGGAKEGIASTTSHR